MKPLDQCRLYAFIDSAYLRGRDPLDLAQQLCDGGADLIQLRAKDWKLSEIRATAQKLLPLVESANVGLVINDYPELAREIGAALCHLGQEDFFDAGFQHVSEITTGSPLQIGLSSHAPAQAERAVAAGAAYVAIGPVYATATKPTARPVTLDYVRWAATHLTVPWFAIGGINLQNLDAVLEAGAMRICVVSAILDDANVTRACQAFKDRLESFDRRQSKSASQ
jgi:thiamine-phosphate pyrophosphorylase